MTHSHPSRSDRQFKVAPRRKQSTPNAFFGQYKRNLSPASPAHCGKPIHQATFNRQRASTWGPILGTQHLGPIWRSARLSYSLQVSSSCCRRKPRHSSISTASSAGLSGAAATVIAGRAIIPRRIHRRTATIRTMILPPTARTAKASRAPTAATAATATVARTARVPAPRNLRPRIRPPKVDRPADLAADHQAGPPNRRATSRAFRRRADRRR